MLVDARSVVKNVAAGTNLGNDIAHLKLQGICLEEHGELETGHSLCRIFDFGLLRLDYAACSRQFNGSLFEGDAEIRINTLVL